MEKKSSVVFDQNNNEFAIRNMCQYFYSFVNNIKFMEVSGVKAGGFVINKKRIESITYMNATTQVGHC